MRAAEAADDRMLVKAAQAGDRRALETLLRRHYDRIHAVCRRITGSDRDADDAAQEAMISIVRGLPRFDRRSAFSTWTYRIATNAALDELRRRRRRPIPHVDAAATGAQPEVADARSHRQLDAVADRLAIDAALDELPEEFKVAVVLRDVCELDYAEIAATLDVPVGTVKSRIARGRALLADRLGNLAEPPERPTTTPRHETDDG
jgi:RNA polymerase sigma-70 factor (ECF subfamily)